MSQEVPHRVDDPERARSMAEAGDFSRSEVSRALHLSKVSGDPQIEHGYREYAKQASVWAEEKEDDAGKQFDAAQRAAKRVVGESHADADADAETKSWQSTYDDIRNLPETSGGPNH